MSIALRNFAHFCRVLPVMVPSLSNTRQKMGETLSCRKRGPGQPRKRYLLSLSMALMFAMMDKSERGNAIRRQVVAHLNHVATADVEARLRRSADDLRVAGLERARLLEQSEANRLDLERAREMGRQLCWCEMTLTLQSFLQAQGLSLVERSTLSILALEEEVVNRRSFAPALLVAIDRHPVERVMVYPMSVLERWWAERGLALWVEASPRASDAFLRARCGISRAEWLAREADRSSRDRVPV